MVKRRLPFLSLAGLLLCLLLFLNGCSLQGGTTETSDTQDSQSGEKTVIHYYDTTDGVLVAQIIVDAYNAQSTDTYVQMHIIDNEEYDDLMRDRLLAKDPTIDCLFLRQPCQVNQYATHGFLTDLTDRVAQSNLDMAGFGSTFDTITTANTIPALPRTKSVWLLFYNIDVFEELGLPEPSNLTWEEYAQLTLQLTTVNEDGSIRYGGYIPPWTLNIGAVAAGEYLYDDDLPYTREYIQLLDRLYNIDQSHPGVELMEGEYNLPNPVFLDQEIATMINGDWTVLLFQNAFPEQSSSFRWGIATLPVFDDVAPMTSIGSCSYLAIPETCENKDNAFDFISFFCGSEYVEKLAELPTCPAYYTERIASVYLESANVPGAEYVFDSFVRSEEGAYVNYRELNDLFKDCMLDFLGGNGTLNEAFDLFIQQRIPILQEE